MYRNTCDTLKERGNPEKHNLDTLNNSVTTHEPFFKIIYNNGLTLMWVMGLDDRLSLFSAEGERGPEELGACGWGVILAPVEICMLASWAAYSCCKKGRNQQNRQAIKIARQQLVSGFPLSFSLLSSSMGVCLSQPHREVLWKQMCVRTYTHLDLH